MQWRNILNFSDDTRAELRLADGAANMPILLTVCEDADPAPMEGVRLAVLKTGRMGDGLPLLMASAIRLLRADAMKNGLPIPPVLLLGTGDAADAALHLTCHWQEESFTEPLGVPYDWYPSGAAVIRPSAAAVERAIGPRRMPLYMVANAELMPLLSRMDWVTAGELHLLRTDERAQGMIPDAIAYLRRMTRTND